ncbi:MAG: SDR family oxidoreductase [Bacteroidetes bacterium]|nr:SDR family oxidoreductase [Bacteroidota bacterium]
MTILVAGASGATGSKLVNQLLTLDHQVKIIVRSPEKLPDSWKTNSNLTIIQASILEINQTEMQKITADCQAVASCLGHNPTIKGIFGEPRKLVRDAVQKICKAVEANKPDQKVKFVLMNTVGNSNRDISEPISFAQKMVVGLIRLTVPPHADNEQAADYLRVHVGQTNSYIEWAVVRPDTLTIEEEVSTYKTHASPIRSAIFNAGKTSRINVAHFMASLINDKQLWAKWKGQMPVVYNS